MLCGLCADSPFEGGERGMYLLPCNILFFVYCLFDIPLPPLKAEFARCLKLYYLASNFLTISEIAFPSALPANCLVATPITFPMSAGEEAPVEAMIF